MNNEQNKNQKNNEQKKDIKNYDPDLENGQFFLFPLEFIGSLKSEDENDKYGMDIGDLAFLSGNAVKIYVLFKAMKNYKKNKKQIFPSYEYISKKTGIKSNKTIANAILELIETGWIEDVKRNGFSSYNKYYVNSKKEINDDLIDRKHRDKEFLSRRIKKAKKEISKREEEQENEQNKQEKEEFWGSNCLNIKNIEEDYEKESNNNEDDGWGCG
jgi:hypothetical protein